MAHSAWRMDPKGAISAAVVVFDNNERHLMALLDGSARDARGLLIGAAKVLESCAQTWEALGSVGGERRGHLLRGLEGRLNQIEANARCAEQSYSQAATPSEVHGATLRARAALRALRREPLD